MPEALAGPWQDHSIEHDGRHLAFRIHNPAAPLTLLALHGWRDNAASFDLLAPLLPQCRLVAIDMPGHGQSAWRSPDAGYYIWNYVDDVLAVADSLQVQHFHLAGHSMGGAVACLLAALVPERLDKLVLLDAVGPLATAPADAPAQMRRALAQQRPGAVVRKYYPSFAAAVRARAAKGLSLAAAEVLGKRGIGETAEGFYWTLDPRLTRANPLSLSEAHAEAFIHQIRCPVQLIAAPSYWQERQAWFNRRLAYFPQLELHELPGGHHQHLDGQVEAVAALVKSFLGCEAAAI